MSDVKAESAGPRRRGATGKVGVQPVLGFPGDRGKTGEQQLGVRPRAHGQSDVDAARAKVPVLVQRLGQEQILPAAEQQQRHLDLVERGVDPQRLPERVIVRRGRQPGLPPRRRVAEQGPAGGTQRRLTGGPHHALLSPQLADAGADPARIFLVCHQVAPAEEVVDRERAGTPSRKAHVMGTRDDHARDKLRRRILQQCELGEAQIRDSDGSEATGEPWLLAHPLDGVGAVGRLVDHRRKVTARSECPSHALQHHAIPAGGMQVGEHDRERKCTAVGAAGQQGADDLSLGFVDVGDQLDTVPHRDPDLADGVARGRRFQS